MQQTRVSDSHASYQGVSHARSPPGIGGSTDLPYPSRCSATSHGPTQFRRCSQPERQFVGDCYTASAPRSAAFHKSGRWGSNPRPSAWEAHAAPHEHTRSSQLSERHTAPTRSNPLRAGGHWRATGAHPHGAGFFVRLEFLRRTPVRGRRVTYGRLVDDQGLRGRDQRSRSRSRRGRAGGRTIGSCRRRRRDEKGGSSVPHRPPARRNGMSLPVSPRAASTRPHSSSTRSSVVKKHLHGASSFH